MFNVRIKKAIAPILAALSLAALLTSCGDADGAAAPQSTSQPLAILSPTASPSPTATVTPAPSQTATVTPAPSPTATQTHAPSPIATATQTPAPSPIATAAHTPAPIPTATAAPAPQFDAFAFIRRLTDEYSPRESASDEELRAARFLRGEMDAMGYDAEIRPFSFERVRVETSFSRDGAPPESVASYRIALSGVGAVEGALADAGTGFADDIPPGGLDGKVALIERGATTFEEKVRRAADAGAVGVIVFNNAPGGFWGTLAAPADIPAVSIDRAAGLRMRSAAAGDARASVSVTNVSERSRNVVALIPSSGGAGAGAADGGGAVIIGAHYDTVADTPGANDNASGVAALMAVAARVRDESYPFQIKFVLFGAEETGLFGSRHYAQEMSADDVANTLAMLNLDVVGTGDRFETMGDLALARDAAEVGETLGARVSPSSESGVTSDHAPFAERGIPALFLMANDLSRINSPQDEIRHVDPKLPQTAAEITVGVLDILAEKI